MKNRRQRTRRRLLASTAKRVSSSCRCRRRPQTDFGRIEGTIADCLIYGPTEFSENLAVLAAHPEQYEYLVRQLAQKLLESGMTPEKLDAWLKRVKKDGYLQLIEGGRKLAEEDREGASGDWPAQMIGANNLVCMPHDGLLLRRPDGGGRGGSGAERAAAD